MNEFDRVTRNEVYAYEHDILCDHHIDYLDCGDCRVPDFTKENHDD